MPGPGWQLAATGHRAEPVRRQEQQGLPTLSKLSVSLDSLLGRAIGTAHRLHK